MFRFRLITPLVILMVLYQLQSMKVLAEKKTNNKSIDGENSVKKDVTNVISDEQTILYLKNWGIISNKLFNMLIDTYKNTTGFTTMECLVNEAQNIFKNDKGQEVLLTIINEIEDTLTNKNARNVINRIIELFKAISTQPLGIETYNKWYEVANMPSGFENFVKAINEVQGSAVKPETIIFLQEFYKIMSMFIKPQNDFKKGNSLRRLSPIRIIEKSIRF